MKSILIIEHGKTTCAVKPGKFCMFLWAKNFGTHLVCHLFDDEPCGSIQKVTKGDG